jgi:hypothetical protein
MQKGPPSEENGPQWRRVLVLPHLRAAIRVFDYSRLWLADPDSTNRTLKFYAPPADTRQNEGGHMLIHITYADGSRCIIWESNPLRAQQFAERARQQDGVLSAVASQSPRDTQPAR